MDKPGEMMYGYLDGYRDMMSRQIPPRHVPIISCLAENQRLVGLEDVETILSIGPAAGDIDVEVLSAFPNCGRYIGVEPRDENIKALKTLMSERYPHLKVETHQCKAEDWDGQASSVDAILLFHVAYFIHDFERSLRRMTSWLKPGGVILTLNENELTTSYKSYPDFAKLIPSFNNPLVQNELGDMFRKMPDMKVVNEFRFETSVDFRHRSSALGAYVFQRPYSEQEVEVFFDMMQAVDPSGIIPTGQTITVIKKDEL